MIERIVELGRGACSIAEAGAGGTPLLFVHGFSGAKEDFTPWLDTLAADGWHAVAYDHFGHGNSAKPEHVEDYTLVGYRDQLFEVLASLGWPACVALGHSMGGMILEEALVDAPERFRAVVLMDTHHGSVATPPDYPEMIKGLLASGGVKALLDAVNAMGELESAPSAKAAADRDPGYQAFNERKFLATAAPVFLAMLNELGSRTDRLDDLRTVAVPSLVIVGAEDGPFLGPSRAMAEAIPGARLVVVPDASHCPQFENTAAWWEAVGGFLAEVAAAKPTSANDAPAQPGPED